MPETNVYTYAAQYISILPERVLFAIFNGAGSGRVVRVHDIWMSNPHIATVSPPQSMTMTAYLSFIDSYVPHFRLRAVPHDMRSPQVPTDVVFGWGGKVNISRTIRRYSWSNDESTTGESVWEQWQNLHGLGSSIWSSPNPFLQYRPTQALTLREGEGLSLTLDPSLVLVPALIYAPWGSVDIMIDCTIEEG
jgi:hypothetical protein